MSFNIEIPSGTSARLLVGGKYCDRDIVVTATGSEFDGIYVNDQVISLPEHIFEGCTWLRGVSCANMSMISAYAFADSGLMFAELPKLKALTGGCFRNTMLERINLPSVTTIYSQAFYSCRKLVTVILGSTTMVDLRYKDAFSLTPIEDGTGYIYVPSALVDSYKTAENWSTYADQFRAIEDYPDICGETETNLGGTE